MRFAPSGFLQFCVPRVGMRGCEKVTRDTVIMRLSVPHASRCVHRPLKTCGQQKQVGHDLGDDHRRQHFATVCAHSDRPEDHNTFTTELKYLPSPIVCVLISRKGAVRPSMTNRLIEYYGVAPWDEQTTPQTYKGPRYSTQILLGKTINNPRRTGKTTLPVETISERR